MARGEMLTVFSYDVVEDKRRRKIAHLLEGSATRVQKSVFETRLTKARAEALAQRVSALLGNADSLRVYVLGADGEMRSRVFGNGAPFESDEGFWLF
jgi:CRISPR-associated protein Cas2